LANDIEKYLGPIYSSESKFVIALLSRAYPKKIWTKFESDNFKQRFGEGSVIPIWYDDAPPGMFDETRRVGGLSFNPQDDFAKQVKRIAEILAAKLRDERQIEARSSENR
jgi:hypothetical protein